MDLADFNNTISFTVWVNEEIGVVEKAWKQLKCILNKHNVSVVFSKGLSF